MASGTTRTEFWCLGMLKRELTLKDGIALSIGSIMGSGILFLPSLTSKIAGADALISWIVSIVLCLPLLFLFSDMLKAVPNESGLKGFISLGLGQRIAGSVPILVIGTVVLGMPAAAIIACDYFGEYLNLTHGETILSAVGFVTIAFIPAILGARIGGKIQQVVAVLLAVTAIALFVITVPYASPNYESISISFDLNLILQAGVVCFWAFAGFENMTFLAGEFKNPRKDIITSISIALISCGAIYLMVSLNYIAAVPQSQIDSSVGLYQLASIAGDSLPVVITVFAMCCVFINFVSWTWGISRMLYSSSKDKPGFEFLSALDKKSIPRNALFFLWGLFVISIGVNYLYPGGFERMLQIVSANFVVLYILAAISYAKYSRTRPKQIVGISIAGMLAFALVSNPYLLVYPLILVSIGVPYSFISSRRGALRGRAC